MQQGYHKKSHQRSWVRLFEKIQMYIIKIITDLPFSITYSSLIIFVVTWVFIQSVNQKIIFFSIFWRNIRCFFFFFFLIAADTILSRSDHKVNLWNKQIALISLFLGILKKNAKPPVVSYLSRTSSSMKQ